MCKVNLNKQRPQAEDGKCYFAIFVVFEGGGGCECDE